MVAVKNFEAPDLAQALQLLLVLALGGLRLLHPCLVGFELQLLLVETFGKFVSLLSGWQRFECILEPLLDGDLHLVVAATSQNLREPVQGVVAVFVKFAVAAELVHGGLLAIQLHLLDGLDHLLGGHELRVSPVVRL